MLHKELTASIIGAFYEVHHALGHGFLESVYERAMLIALSKRGHQAERQVPVAVHYGSHLVGEFLADLQVEKSVVIEMKACRVLDPAHEAQLVNYLRASRIEVGLLFNFSPKPAFRRVFMTNDRKPHGVISGLSLPSVPSVVAVGSQPGGLPTH